jgi:hypothetical protein
MAVPPASSSTSHLPSTRVLLICAALAAVQVGIFIVLSPVLVSLPALSPPLYAVVAGVHSVMIFLAPRITGARWAASVTAAVAGLVIAAMSPIGLFVALLILIPGVLTDVALSLPASSGRRAATETRYIAGALAAAIVLFAISLPAFSAEHLTGAILFGAAAGRVLGEGLAYVCARALAASLARAGIRPTAA